MPARQPRLETDGFTAKRFRYRHGTRAHLDSKRLRRGSDRNHHIIHDAEFRKVVMLALARASKGRVRRDGDSEKPAQISKAAIDALRNVTQTKLTQLIESTKPVLKATRTFVLTPRILSTVIAIPQIQSGRYLAPDIPSRIERDRALAKARSEAKEAARKVEIAEAAAKVRGKPKGPVGKGIAKSSAAAAAAAKASKAGRKKGRA